MLPFLAREIQGYMIQIQLYFGETKLIIKVYKKNYFYNNVQEKESFLNKNLAQGRFARHKYFV